MRQTAHTRNTGRLIAPTHALAEQPVRASPGKSTLDATATVRRGRGSVKQDALRA